MLKLARRANFGGGGDLFRLIIGAFGSSASLDQTCVSHSKFKKIFGFTLAEVLIVVAIIGVVAAMTIPNLIGQCQKIVLANQAKREYFMWTQAFKMILDGNEALNQTSLWKKMNSYGVYSWNSPSSNYAFWSELSKYVKIAPSEYRDYEEAFEYDNANHGYSVGYPVYLANGTKLVAYDLYRTPEYLSDAECSGVKSLGGSMCSNIGYIYIDVNGNNDPNTYGRDIFGFNISAEGVLYPIGGKDYALYRYPTTLNSTTSEISDEYGNVHTRELTNEYYWKNRYAGTKSQNARTNGIYRTGQLVEEGWKMNY